MRVDVLLCSLAKDAGAIGVRSIGLKRQENVQVLKFSGIIFALFVYIGEKQVGVEGLRAVHKSFMGVVFRVVESVRAKQDNPEHYVPVRDIRVLL